VLKYIYNEHGYFDPSSKIVRVESAERTGMLRNFCQHSAHPAMHLEFPPDLVSSMPGKT